MYQALAVLIALMVVLPIMQLRERKGMRLHPPHRELEPDEPMPEELQTAIDAAAFELEGIGFRPIGTRVLGYGSDGPPPAGGGARARGAEQCFVSEDGSTLGVLVAGYVTIKRAALGGGPGLTGAQTVQKAVNTITFVTPAGSGWVSTGNSRLPAIAPRPTCERRLWVPGVEPIARLYAMHQRFVRHLGPSQTAAIDLTKPFALVDLVYAEACATRLRDGYARLVQSGSTVAMTLKGACYAFWHFHPLTRWIPRSVDARRRARLLQAIGAG